jgi:hypothetical protein
MHNERSEEVPSWEWNPVAERMRVMKKDEAR